MATNELVADPKGLSTWAHGRNRHGKSRSRHDYDSDDHLIADMLAPSYFKTIENELEPNDLVWLLDAKQEQALIRIDWVDRTLRTMGVSLVERIAEIPVVGSDGYGIKWRGPRGGFWCVVDGEGVIVREGHRTKEEAARARDVLNSTSEAA